MKYFLILVLLSCGKADISNELDPLYSGSANQFAEEERRYKPGVDTGFSKYLAKSIWKSKKVVLTFDDGPTTYTEDLLDLLKDKSAKATFFILGEKLRTQKNKDLVKRMIKEGHIVASHTMTHENSNEISELLFKNELKNSFKKIYDLGYQKTEKYFRFPYGAYGKNSSYHHFNSIKELGKELYNENCINFVFWDVDTSDWYSKRYKNGAKRISDTAMAYLRGGYAYDFSQQGGRRKIEVKDARGGGVILMHDNHNKVVKATESLLESLDAEGFSITPLNEVDEYFYPGHMVCELVD